MQKLLGALLNLLLPPKDDVRVARTLSAEMLERMMRPRIVGDAKILSLFPYSDPHIRALIRSVKFYGERTVLKPLAEVAGAYILELISDRMLFYGWNTPILVPIPSSATRLKERGYNQAERIATALFSELNGSVQYEPHALGRKERTSQVRITREKRGENIREAFFAVNPESVRGKYILLLDDVVESGATLKDARRALLEAGAADVLGIALAH